MATLAGRRPTLDGARYQGGPLRDKPHPTTTEVGKKSPRKKDPRGERSVKSATSPEPLPKASANILTALPTHLNRRGVEIGKRRDPGDLSGASSELGCEVTSSSDFASSQANSLACSLFYIPARAGG